MAHQLNEWIKLLRPVQWVKNGFVLAPLLFSRQYHDSGAVKSALIAFAAFCAASSATYIFNDLHDRKEDRRHPTKKNRPLARGTVDTGAAIGLLGSCFGIALGLAGMLGFDFVALVAIFLLINAAYTIKLKHLAILDVLTIAAGFVLRIWAGSAAIDVKPSHWLLLCTIMLSLFLGLTKRRAEMALPGAQNGASRGVLREYSLPFLDQAISMITGVTILCYVLYTVDAATVARFGTHNLVLTVPFVLYGMFRYLYLLYHRGGAEDPTQVAVTDLPMVINLILWVISAWLVIQHGRQDLFL